MEQVIRKYRILCQFDDGSQEVFTSEAYDCNTAILWTRASYVSPIDTLTVLSARL